MKWWKTRFSLLRKLFNDKCLANSCIYAAIYPIVFKLNFRNDFNFWNHQELFTVVVEGLKFKQQWFFLWFSFNSVHSEASKMTKFSFFSKKIKFFRSLFVKISQKWESLQYSFQAQFRIYLMPSIAYFTPSMATFLWMPPEERVQIVSYMTLFAISMTPSFKCHNFQ